MKQLNNLQTALFGLGGALMVIGAGCFCFMFQQTIASFVFLAGAILFSLMQCLQTYEGTNFTIRRLKSIMNLADLMFIIAAVLMIDTAITNSFVASGYQGTLFLRSLFTNHETYLECVYNKWLPTMLIGAILEVYTNHRISSEMKKESSGK